MYFIRQRTIQQRHCENSSRQDRKCVAQSTPVATTSLLPPLKVRCTNGRIYGYAKFAYRSMRRRRGNHGQSICIAGTRWDSEMRRSTAVQWTLATVTSKALIFTSDGQLELLRTFVSSGVRRRHFVILSAICIRSSASTPITRFRLHTFSWPENNCNVSRRLGKAVRINGTVN